MKNTILKILGIVLAIAMLSGLLIMAAPTATPVSAANLAWSNVYTPLMGAGTSAGVYSISGDGKTVYAWTQGQLYSGTTYSLNSVTYNYELYKSADGGFTWSNSGLDTSTPPVLSSPTVTIKQIAVNPGNINDIEAIGYDTASGTIYHVYRSINAGQTFYPFDPFTMTPGTVLTSLDVANGSSGLVSILVSFTTGFGAGGIALFDSSIGTWRYTGGSGSTDLGTASWGSLAGLAVKFSTNYANDAAILAVSANSTSTTNGVMLRGMIVTTGIGSQWNQSGGIKDAILKQGSIPITPTATQVADIAIPSDFVPTSTVQNRVFVGIGDSSITNANINCDVYRVNGGTSSSTAYSLGASVNVASVAYAGTSSAGEIAAGTYISNSGFPTGTPIYSTNQVTSNTPTWNSSANSPSGMGPIVNGTANGLGDAIVTFMPGSTATSFTLYCGTAGKNSELATSTDCNSFAGVGLFNVSSFSNVSLGKESGFGTGVGGNSKLILLVVKDLASPTAPPTAAPNDCSLFLSADAGNTFKKIFDNGNISFTFSTSPAFGTDKTIYMWQTQNSSYSNNITAQIIKTNDGGMTWTLLNTPGNVTCNWLTPIDANTYWIASPERGIQNSSSSTYVAIGGRIPNQMFVFPGMFFVDTKQGDVFLSTDSGVTFNQMGSLGQFVNGGGQAGPESSTGGAGFPPCTFDIPNKTIYVVDLGTHNIDKWTVGTDSSWQIYLNSSSLPAQLQLNSTTTSSGGHPISAISIGSDGFWYMVSGNNYDMANGAATPNPQVWYTSDILNITFAPLTGTDVSSLGSYDIFPYWSPVTQTKDANGNSVYWLEDRMGTFYSTQTTVTVNGVSTTYNPGQYVISAGSATLSPNGYPYEIITYTNSLAGPPKVTAPAAKATVGTPMSSNTGTFAQVNFSWPAVNYQNARYEFEVAYDTAFNSIASAGNGATFATYNYANSTFTAQAPQTLLDLTYILSNSVAAVPLNPGQTFYWRIRVDYPVISQWSAATQFSTAVVSSTSGGLDQAGRINPVNGATGISVTPAITWGSVPGATGYDFKIATDPAFTNIVDSKSAINTTVYAPASALKANTTYYWEVRALNGTAAGDWVISAFTTQVSAVPTGTAGPAPVAPAPPQTIVVTIPPQPQQSIVVTIPPNTVPAPAPSTPAYVWVIIVIGAVLVIAVIILIARTRRV